MHLWHNEEADALAKKVQIIIDCWKRGAICPSNFLAELEDTVRDAGFAKEQMRLEVKNEAARKRDLDGSNT